MDTINIDTFSEQLGIYDFFNVIVSGSIMGMLWYLIWPGFFENDILKRKVSTSVLVVLAIVLCYFLGMVIQEIGSIADRYFFRTKERARITFLKDITKKEKCLLSIKIMKRKIKIKWYFKNNSIIDNPVRLGILKKYATEILDEEGILYEDKLTEEQMRYVYTRMEYRVAYIGRERKMEKLRALFSMARSMLVCMGVAFVLLMSTILMEQEHFMQIGSFWWIIITIGGFGLFYYRMQKTMRYMVLIMLGNYEADYQERKNREKQSAEENLIVSAKYCYVTHELRLY